MSASDETMIPVHDTSFAIVAGGRASRLGGIRKPLMRFGGRTVLEAQLALGGRFPEILLSANDASWAPPGARRVPDLIPERGAPGGVHAVLSAARTPWVLIVAGDMPFITAPVLDRLLAERGDQVDAVCFEVAGRWEPLLGLYRAELSGRWGALLGEQPSLRRLLEQCRVRVLPEVALGAVDPRLQAVVSVNEPKDVVRLGGELPEPDQ